MKVMKLKIKQGQTIKRRIISSQYLESKKNVHTLENERKDQKHTRNAMIIVISVYIKTFLF